MNGEIDIEKEGMGTTIVAATIKGEKLIVANVGDSRLYIINSDLESVLGALKKGEKF